MNTLYIEYTRLLKSVPTVSIQEYSLHVGMKPQSVHFPEKTGR